MTSVVAAASHIDLVLVTVVSVGLLLSVIDTLPGLTLNRPNPL